MSQHDMDVSRLDTNTGTGVRQGLNDALKALASNSSGPSEPGTPYAFQWWADEASGWMKIRNAANTAWIAMFPLAYAVIPMTEEGDIVYGGGRWRSDEACQRVRKSGVADQCCRYGSGMGHSSRRGIGPKVDAAHRYGAICDNSAVFQHDNHGRGLYGRQRGRQRTDKAGNAHQV